MIGWVDGAAGASGDMLLGALVDAGVPLAVLQSAVDALGTEPVVLRAEPVRRAGLGATRVHVDCPPTSSLRRWSDVRDLLSGHPHQERAAAVFARLARAEAAVHRVDPQDVHFHEVGALDALADVVGVVAGFAFLGLQRLSTSALSLGSGTTRGAHGPLPVPAPAVLELLRGLPAQAGAAPHEMSTPTGAALLAELTDVWEALPPLAVDRVGVGAGARDPAEVANVLRLVLGEPAGGEPAGREPAGREDAGLVLATNVDDLDPRLWPAVLAALLAAGADDAWLTPVLMKKGRPAHTLSALCPPSRAGDVRRVLFRETSTLGVRSTTVGRVVLDRQEHAVEVGGQRVRVKVGLLSGEVVNVMPEWEDVAAAAATLGRPAKQVLLDAHAAAAHLRPGAQSSTPSALRPGTQPAARPGPPPAGSGPETRDEV